VWVLATTGCYASHGPREEGGALCVRLSMHTGSPCGISHATIPAGVCRLADGALIAFGDLDHGATCGAVGREDPASTFAFEPHSCEGGGMPRTRVVALCGASSDVPVFSQFERPPGRTVAFDLTDTSCALSPGIEGEPAEPWAPWEPFVATTSLCSDPYAWCGSPMVLSLFQRGGDPCAGATYTHRCTARVEGDRIVLRPETAREVMTVCETAIGDRIARCLVPPLPAGRYFVVDETERVLGAVTVPAVRPEGDLEPTCTPL
jgi:hypothetical protein